MEHRKRDDADDQPTGESRTDDQPEALSWALTLDDWLRKRVLDEIATEDDYVAAL